MTADQPREPECGWRLGLCTGCPQCNTVPAAPRRVECCPLWPDCEHPDQYADKAAPDNPATSGEAAGNLRARIIAAIEAADDHSCMYQDGIDAGGLADAVIATVQAAYVPPPPGSDRDKLPDHVLAVLDLGPYLSTACQTAMSVELAIDAGHDVGDWAERMHSSCRLTRKWDLAPCICTCHQAVTP